VPSKKKVHLQQFGIIHLSNSDLTYIRNLEREKICYVLPHLETYIRNPKIESKLFLCPSTSSTTEQMRHGYARAEGRDVKLLSMPSCFAKLLEANFSCFDKIKRMPS
jgi:hypothetical protein